MTARKEHQAGSRVEIDARERKAARRAGLREDIGAGSLSSASASSR